ncbi:hypothetical protein B0H16DRAFT_1524419 [Mycena metata]|uniref:DUF6534 domain-containing protein n=1 Tax=Mycena metata TaxID=1033252 RepID=A0AAD7JLJ5_9AGAR|nr:hypothetical protein B0H16DRAFT_1524419 [Mycena metata]
MPSVAQLTLPMFLGTILNWALFGTLLVQVYIYFSAFPQDRRWWKHLVIAIVFLETVETFANARDMIHIFGVGFGNMDVLDNVGWAWFSVPVMGSIIACICQTFYGWRLYIISQNPFVFGLIMLVSAVQLVAGLWTGVNICIAKKFSLLQSFNLIPTATWLAATSCADLLIVAGTVYSLHKSRQPEFGSKRTNSIITRVITLTAETGILCMAFALVDLFLFVNFPSTNYHLAVCIELSKIYSNSILLIFNSRAHIGHSSQTTDVDVSTSIFKGHSSSTATRGIELKSGMSRNDTLVGKNELLSV